MRFSLSPGGDGRVGECLFHRTDSEGGGRAYGVVKTGNGEPVSVSRVQAGKRENVGVGGIAGDQARDEHPVSTEGGPVVPRAVLHSGGEADAGSDAKGVGEIAAVGSTAGEIIPNSPAVGDGGDAAGGAGGGGVGGGIAVHPRISGIGTAGEIHVDG